MVIGLTGAYCSGKSSAAEILERNGAVCFDLDKLGHEALAIAQDRIVKSFGESIVTSEGIIDRRVLGRMLFADSKKLAEHESIVHPIVSQLLKKRLELAKSQARNAKRNEATFCIHGALLCSIAGVSDFCNVIIEITAPVPLRIARAFMRDKRTLSEIEAIMARQKQKQNGFFDRNIPYTALSNMTTHAALEAKLMRFITKANL